MLPEFAILILSHIWLSTLRLATRNWGLHTVKIYARTLNAWLHRKRCQVSK
jgi:hypothetical protein